MQRTRADPEAEPRSPVHRLWSGDLFRVGEFRAAPSHPRFRDSGPMRGSNIVFPRTNLRIRWAEGGFRWSDPAVINLYNDGDEYERAAVAPEGDRSFWIELRPGLLETLQIPREAGAGMDPAHPWLRRQVPSDPKLFLEMRRLIVALRGQGIAAYPQEPLWVEERGMLLLGGVFESLVALADRPRRIPGHPSTALVEAARERLASRVSKPLSLAELARDLGYSSYHLARTFRAGTGTTLHRYRLSLRLHRAVDRLLDGEDDLTNLAFDLGFSSHSHFSATFRRHLDSTPSAARLGRTGLGRTR
ncbi:MAG: AraC family transcriptional regulator [Acidobacteriota bacterium]